MNWIDRMFRSEESAVKSTNLRSTRVRPLKKQSWQTASAIERMLRLSGRDMTTGRYRILLYRFLADNIPIVGACVWTWMRLAASSGRYVVSDQGNSARAADAEIRLAELSDRFYFSPTGAAGGISSLLPDLFSCLFRDGLCGGFVTVKKDASSVDRLIMVDPLYIRLEDHKGRRRLVYDDETVAIPLDRSDFYYIPLSNSITDPMGKSILQSVPFVSYIEQQLIDDMRRSSHNSGYHRLHVKITPPERYSGESDSAYVDRINKYFDKTVDMIKDCDVDENPVTWDNIAIESVGPENARSVTNSWFMHHRAMIEEICAGTGLSPFLLGYSYGATTSWSGFKFDMVMRQIKSIQAEVSQFLQWVGNIELALAGYDLKCRFEFDNSLQYRAQEDAAIETNRLDSILKLYEAGLLDKQSAQQKIQWIV